MSPAPEAQPAPPTSLPYVYDNHVPVVFFGLGVKPENYRRNTNVREIAPIPAAAIGVEIASGAFGNVLLEIAP